MTYRIKGWDAHFEKSQTRKCSAMKWVPVSNKHDGKSYRRIMRMERRAEIYAVWVLLIQVASKCPVRGILEDSDGPLTPDDLELKTGMPAESFAYAMPVLASSVIGWLETDCGQTTSTLPADSQPATSTLPPDYQHGVASVGLQDRTGQDITEQENIRDPETPVVVPHTKKRFVPPELSEVQAYFRERNNGLDAEAFVAYYEANGWRQSNGNPIKKWQAAVITWEKTQVRGLGFHRGIPEKPTGSAKLPPSTVTPEFIMLWDDANTHAGLDRWFLAQTRLAHTPENRRKIHSLRNYHARKMAGCDHDGKKTANNLHSDVKAWWQGRDFADMTNRDDWEAADAVIAVLEGGQ